MASDSNRTTAYIDGGCPLCSREVKFLKSKDADIDFVDVADEACGLDEETRAKYLKFMHVRDEQGQIHKGAAAFALMYQSTPGMEMMGRLLGLPLIRHVGDGAYRLFLFVRPLWRKQTSPN
jgi:Uncharacterized protein conserved in bacteria